MVERILTEQPLGARFIFLGGLPASQRRRIGIAMIPQAGVAHGMALLAVKRFPELTNTILPIVTASTVVFELVCPIATHMALH